MAHEIAHNLVQLHTSEHEFYFSSICQKYLPGLTQLTLEEKSGKDLGSHFAGDLLPA